MQKPHIQPLTDFLIDYTAKMLSIGTYTARIDRCVSRIAKAYGYDVSLTIFVKHFTISVMDPLDNSIRRTYVKTSPPLPINFHVISELSALSWQIHDERFDLETATEHFAEITSYKNNEFLKTLVFISLANSAFCRLFGGDVGGIIAVFLATFIGFYARFLLAKFKINLKLQYIVASFLASFVAYLGVFFGFSSTPDATIGSSVLFLMPGIYMINSIFDILNENILVGISRATSTGILILCIAIGFYMTLSISNIGVISG
ncbi:threonine/serine ThrE exporter family protein [Campylobacter suis]|uniref:Inner membrane protein YjjP n=1 Tax=Campylobacter suis TaxID=2790657 RepID=A0ABM8Q145_9BACT|nr:threonine/serine exporter family protein [Campylobacter suis]CAD7286549.1 Inner membrane protein YjjP [Campylobacter suis]